MHIPNGYHRLEPGKIANVVTNMEMRERPGLRAEPFQAPWMLRRIHVPELAWYRDAYRRIGADYLWSSRLAMTDEALASVLNDRANHVYALFEEDRCGGILELDFRSVPDCELAFLGVEPPLLGTGAGRWLMNRAIEIAWSQPIARFWLHTCTLDHPRAVDFYRRSGFRPFAFDVEVLDDPRLSGLLPRSAAPNVPIL